MDKERVGFRVRPAAIVALFALALAGPACWKPHTVYLEDQLPLAAPVEGAPATGDVVDPPTRVARIGEASGVVTIRQGSADQWTPALGNLPLTDGDALWSGPDAKAEVQVGSTRLRTGNATSLSVLRINDRFFQVGLDQGALIVRIAPADLADSAEIDTPAGSVNLTEPGAYRLDMDATLPSGSVTVRSGQARISLEGEVVEVEPGQRILLTGGDAPSYLVEKAPVEDAFETWSEIRDQSEAQSPSARKLGREVMGATDLDRTGTWQVHPQLGDLWVPRVAQDWAPYRDGRWTWTSPWGWTWVDDAPWGFATSHYGRWTRQGGAWAWQPRDPAASPSRPVYAPALVAFAGQPTGLFSQPKMTGGGVAWFPLGPREPYLPTYPASRSYRAALNGQAVPPGQARTTWANLAVPGAMTAVPRSVFTSFAEVASAAVPIKKPSLFLKAPVGGAPALSPGPHSFPEGAAPSRPPAVVQERPLMARSPLPAQPLPLAAALNAIQANHGRPQALPARASQGRPRTWINAVVPNHGVAPRNLALPLAPPPAPAAREEVVAAPRPVTRRAAAAPAPRAAPRAASRTAPRTAPRRSRPKAAPRRGTAAEQGRR